ncbi:MAG: hypothetical protein JWP91_3783 [Fibrobacteres bacterium]|nr:hypothetical protein [Fibrobacterota bacterium]
MKKALWLAALAFLVPSMIAWGGFTAVKAYFGHDIGAGYTAPALTLCALDRDGSAGIIVAGDSRAKTQINPAVLEDRTGMRSFNAAEIISLGGDITTFVNALRRQPQALANHPVILLSVTLRGMNDYSVENIPSATLWNWTAYDHARVAAGKPARYWRFLQDRYLPGLFREARHKRKKDGFACADDVFLPRNLVESKGYRPYTGRARDPLPADTGGWIIDGGSWRAFRASLEWLAASPAKAIVIADAPLDPVWRKNVMYPEWRAQEARFAAMLTDEIARHPKARFLDFVTKPILDLDTSYFYDGFHFNRTGADIYTAYLADMLTREILPSLEKAGAASGAGGNLKEPEKVPAKGDD